MSPKTLLLLLLFLVYNPFAHSIYFNFSGFHSNEAASKIFYEGDASNINDDIQLINGWSRVGRVSFVDHVHLYDSTTQNLSDFSTHFTFTMDPLDSSADVYDGLTFFLAPPDFQLPPNSAAGYLGLCNSSTCSITTSTGRFIAIEFDSWQNEWDPPTQHMGVCINSLSSAAYVKWNSSLHVREVADARIHYDGKTKNLTVLLTYENYHRSYNLSYVVDLMRFLPERVMVGFTAATGRTTGLYTIHSWEFNSTLAIEEADPSKTAISWVVVLLIVMGILAVGVGLALLMFFKKRSRPKQAVERGINFTSMNNDFERGAGPKRFSYEALVLATNNFSNEKKLGAGGFGNVYKGFLIDLDMAVAVKRISRGSQQGKREYMTEVKVISQLRHRNLVQLIGWCHEQGELLLVYEIMSNGSLDSHLFGKRRPLKWAVRYKIAIGLASALFYLHEEWEQCVVHRDIKSSNVMLDSGF
ncbi:Protein kinase domain-containing protein [Cinnamomum micranthum f. kanehirae]|uniref:Protein kinase domain-containing protein n=1 Tax=Cinnamomum micranthum f. kanehirae TaxID=337451 RepID=A0A3S3N2D7_9MAGN|nr:Protein kinase domain-containing protein [Cinnamomum micranthum f. kanehirae]